MPAAVSSILRPQIASNVSASGAPTRRSSGSLTHLKAPRTSSDTAPAPSDGARLDIRAAGLPSSVEELFDPWTRGRGAKDLPEWAQGYLSLLAESTTSQGSMQKHLVKLLARGAANSAKLFEFINDPLDGATDALADAGSEMLLQHFSRSSQDEDPSSSSGSTARPGGGWKQLRLAVLGTTCFKGARRSQDDSCTPAVKINPVHSKVLSLLLSCIMSGAVSGLGHALPVHATPCADIPQICHETTHAISMEGRAMQAAASFARAPSLGGVGRHASAVGADGMLGAGGMAMTTTLKLLRGDSKNTTSVANILGNILDTVGDSICDSLDGDASAATPKLRSRTTSNRQAPSPDAKVSPQVEGFQQMRAPDLA